MKKISAAVVVIVLLMAAILSPASADGTIYDLTVNPLETTSLEASWSAVGTDEPLYTITCQAEGTDRITERRTYHTSCIINYLSPETTYIITVSTADGHMATATIAMPSPASYIDFNYSLLDVGLYQATADETDYAAFTTLTGATLADLLDGNDFHFMFRFKLAATTRPKYLDYELVVRMPNGDVYTVPDVFWYENNRTTITEYVPFTRAFEKILRDYGEFPAGEYTLTMYIDNGFAAETTFTME